ncbi:MAG TPA: hypothetical protein VGH10_03055, partial [Actinomycetota bacterium]
VAAIAPDDAWAVGEHHLEGRLRDVHPDVDHWDGTSWTKVAVPGGKVSTAYRVAASGPDDVSVLLFDRNHKPFVERWDGTTWTLTRTDPRDQPSNPDPGSIEALSPTDAWMAGARLAGTQTRALPVAEHWDGSDWSRVPVPHAGDFETVSGLAAADSTDVWMVGTEELGAPGSTDELPESWNWNGASWSFVPIANSHQSAYLSAADALPTGHVWAVGSWSDGSGSNGLIYERCDS